MNKIFLYILVNLVLLFLAIFIGIPAAIILAPVLFKKYYCYIFYIIFASFFAFLIKKKDYLTMVYLFLFLVIMYIFSYGTYKAFFYYKETPKNKKIEIVEKLKIECAKKYTNKKDLNCEKYFRLYNECKEKYSKDHSIDCVEFIWYYY